MNHTYPNTPQQISSLNQFHKNVDSCRIAIDFVDMNNVWMFNSTQHV